MSEVEQLGLMEAIPNGDFCVVWNSAQAKELYESLGNIAARERRKSRYADVDAIIEEMVDLYGRFTAPVIHVSVAA